MMAKIAHKSSCLSFTGVSGLEDPQDEPLKFSRRYLDQNRNTVRILPCLGFRRS
jgi:hypothetical protein